MDATDASELQLPPAGALMTPAAPVAYANLHRSPLFDMGVFFLRAGARLPLHDHPGMVVLSRVLQGTLRWVSYDWLAPVGPGAHPARLSSLARRATCDSVAAATARTRLVYPMEVRAAASARARSA